jgi:hypothetical protein
LDIGLAPILLLAEAQIGPVFTGLFDILLMPRIEQRRFIPHLRVAHTLLSRRRNLVVRASPTSLWNSCWDRRTQKRKKARRAIYFVAQIFKLPVFMQT